jgi:hypothetical protein
MAWKVSEIQKAAMRTRYPERHGLGAVFGHLAGSQWRRWFRDLAREAFDECPAVAFAWAVIYRLQERVPSLRGEDWESLYAIGQDDADLLRLVEAVAEHPSDRSDC